MSSVSAFPCSHAQPCFFHKEPRVYFLLASSSIPDGPLLGIFFHLFPASIKNEIEISCANTRTHIQTQTLLRTLAHALAHTTTTCCTETGATSRPTFNLASSHPFSTLPPHSWSVPPSLLLPLQLLQVQWESVFCICDVLCFTLLLFLHLENHFFHTKPLSRSFSHAQHLLLNFLFSSSPLFALTQFCTISQGLLLLFLTPSPSLFSQH